MKYLLLTIGTRGDAEPFLAIGDLLQKAGHEVIIALPEQLCPLAEDTGLRFEALDRRFLELLEGETARNFMGQKGSAFSRAIQLLRLSRQSMSVQDNMILEQRNLLLRHTPDRVVYHPKCLVARAWGIANEGQSIGISPIPNWLHPVREYPHIAVSRNLGTRGNLLSYRFINWMTAFMSARYVKPFRQDFPGTSLNRRAITHYMQQQERMLYLISPSLFPRPDYWPEQAKVLGYFERPKTNSWQPASELIQFMDRFRAENITFITFGSMINARPEVTTDNIIKVLSRLGIPAIINTSSGGLLKREGVADHIHFVSNIPYEWIFPKVHSVVHHGGSGTTHTATKHGCPSLVIPHIVDQFFWNERVADLGLGPKGVKIKHLSEERFERLLLELRSNEDYRIRAVSFQEKMSAEGKTDLLLEELSR